MQVHTSTTQRRKAKGFTLLELTFSIAFYTFIVMTALVAFIAIFGIYNKGQALSRTQLQARSTMDSLVRDLRNTETITTSTTTPAAPVIPGVTNVFCLQSSTGFSKAYAYLYLTDTSSYHLVRLQNCTSTAGYEMLIGPDTWIDKPSVAGDGTSVGTMQNGPADVKPLQITRLNGTSSPAVWQVTVAAHRGSRDKSDPLQKDLVDQFSAETTLRTVVTTRK